MRSSTPYVVTLITALGATGPAAAQPAERGFGDLVSALAGARTEIVELERTIEVPASVLRTIDAAAWLDRRADGGLVALVEERAAEIEAVRAALRLSTVDVVEGPGLDGSTSIDRALTGRGVSIHDVLAVEVTGGDVFVYHLDRVALAALGEDLAP